MDVRKADEPAPAAERSNALQAVSGFHFGTCTRAPNSSPASVDTWRIPISVHVASGRSAGPCRLSGESSPSLARMDRRRFRGQPGAVGRRLTARASLSSGCYATDTGAGLRRSVRARRLPGSASGIPLVAKEPHVAEPQEASNGAAISPERHHGNSRHEQGIIHRDLKPANIKVRVLSASLRELN